MNIYAALQEEKCHWYLNLAFSLTAKPLDLYPTSHKIFKTFSMIAYINKSQKQKSLVFNSLNFTILNQVTKLNSVYFCAKLRLKFFRGGKCIKRLINYVHRHPVHWVYCMHQVLDVKMPNYVTSKRLISPQLITETLLDMFLFPTVLY